jgi:adenylate kinase
MNIILFGPPGSGKDTQASKILEANNLYHLSTGQVLRDEMKKGSKLGLEITDLMNSGSLVGDDIVNALVEQVILANNRDNVLFNGYPRTKEQAQVLASKIDSKNTIVVELVVEDMILTQRILSRGKTSKRPEDCSIEAIKNRLSLYHKETEEAIPALGFKVHKIDGTLPINQITTKIQNLLV